MQLTAKHIYEGGYIFLPILLSNDLPKTITYRDQTYYLKDEVHISLVCVKKLSTIIDDLEAKVAESKIVHLFKEFTTRFSLDQYELTGELRHVVKDDRRTIIAMVQIDELQNMFNFINEKLNTSFAVQPGHVTLYTLQPNKGIGILNTKELNKLTTIADIYDLSARLK